MLKRKGRNLPRLAAVALAWLLVIYVLLRLPAMPAEARFGGVAAAWVSAILLYAGAFVQARSESAARRRQARGSPKWMELLLLGLVVLGALLARLWRIGDIPFTLAGDEGSQGLEALRVIGGSLRNPFSVGWLSVPTMSFFFNSLSLRLLGRTIVGLRLPWAIVGTAGVLVAYVLVRRLRGPRVALASAAMLAAYHYHIHFSRLGSVQIADPLLAGLAMLFLDRGLTRRAPLDWALLGIVSGLAFYFYAGARLVPVIVLVILGYHLLYHRGTFLKQHGLHVLIALGAFLIAASPMLQFAIRQPGLFNARLNQVGILQSGWLEREVEILGLSKTQILFDQFVRAALAFNFFPDRTVWYGLRQPLLDPVFGSLFLLGLGYATVRALIPGGQRRLFPMVAWWWGGMLLGGMMTESPPSSMRLVTLAVPTVFFVVIGIRQLLLLARKAFEGIPVTLLQAAGALLFAFVSLKTYFVDFTPQRLYGGQRAEMATEMAPFLNELKDGNHFYFVGPPWMYWGFATIPYMVPDAQGVDIMEQIAAPPTYLSLPETGGVVFIFVPERAEELGWVMEAFPGGEVHEFHRSADGRLLGALYRVPAQ